MIVELTVGRRVAVVGLRLTMMLLVPETIPAGLTTKEHIKIIRKIHVSYNIWASFCTLTACMKKVTCKNAITTITIIIKKSSSCQIHLEHHHQP